MSQKLNLLGNSEFSQLIIILPHIYIYHANQIFAFLFWGCRSHKDMSHHETILHGLKKVEIRSCENKIDLQLGRTNKNNVINDPFNA